ncbi:STAS domain-containing protein [Conexibacter sp. SYSU D00693]|uniref:STAS domain-containing protein n=1 Tax=Conexibacter sp. SYSU D00693 TaxID=2812560 RepID=UPI00196AE024|nr:STAS domain-containing protein [Conexibacter sp. SYSU D00693]
MTAPPGPHPFSSSASAQDGAPQLRFAGEFDLAALDDARAALQAAIREADRREVLLDLDEVTFLDSCGLSLLIRARADALRRGGGLRVVALSEPVRQLLELTGTLELLAGEAGSADGVTLAR